MFLVQILSSAAAIYSLRARMLQVVYDDRARQVLDLRDDLLARYYTGGRTSLADIIEKRRGNIADPLIFVALSGGDRPVYSHIGAMPRLAPAPRLQLVPVSRGEQPAEGLAIATRLSDGSHLIVGVSTATERGFNLAFAEAIGLTVVLTTVLALLGSLLVGYTISRRTHAIAETAEALAAGDFAARLPKEQSGDGFDHLRRQMNLMAERIDALVHELQSISASLAHDLRSPVARLRASLDTALREVAAGPAADALLLAKADAETLEQMLLAALELSRLQSGAVVDRRKLLDMGEIASDLVDLYEPLADEGGRSLLARTTPSPVIADRELISRAIANLIDNALKYGGLEIVVATRQAGAWAELTVSDNGPGIARSDRVRAVERFTRLDNARTMPGAGLGLAMVSAVAQLHGGDLELMGEEGGGLVARFRLPIA